MGWMESYTVNEIKEDRLRVGFGGAYRTDYPDEKYESGIQERGGGWRYTWESSAQVEVEAMGGDEITQGG